jgi:hypothetical protein
MKKIKVIIITLILLSAGSFLQQTVAQDKTKAEQEKEAKLQKEIEVQKKEMASQKKAQEEAMKIERELAEKDEDLKDIRIEVETDGRSAGDANRIYLKRGSRAYSFGEPFEFSAPDIQMFNAHMMGDAERTTWDFSKSVKENSFSRDYTFDVEKTVKNVVLSVMGDCKAGEIRIKIIMPNGKNYSDIVIDEFGNLNWRKSFTISETENQDKTGDWKFQITSTKATGFFKISLQTY